MIHNDAWQPEGRGHRARSSQTIRAFSLGQIGQGVNDSYLAPRSERPKVTRVERLLAEILCDGSQQKEVAAPNIG